MIVLIYKCISNYELGLYMKYLKRIILFNMLKRRRSIHFYPKNKQAEIIRLLSKKKLSGLLHR
jgi:hypothetical protein